MEMLCSWKAQRRGRGLAPLSCPTVPPFLGLPVRDTHSRSWGSLGSSFSVFASRTLGKELKGLEW